ncbi:hypothetical protein B0H14DRAFT_3777089 [Mycena olivaceomarginata]|nr:hypothetical protein B0H14DRAFT_3777089 [Mycena olivaceomarginata]
MKPSCVLSQFHRRELIITIQYSRQQKHHSQLRRSRINVSTVLGPSATLRVNKSSSTKTLLGGKLLIWLHGNDKRVVIGRVWSNRVTRDAFFRVWSGIFDAIHTITGFTMNFKVFSKNCSLLGAIGDSEGAQAQGLGDFITLRRLNTPTANGSSTVDVDGILKVSWKTCLVHFKRGVFALETHVEAFVFQILLGFPYLEMEAEFDDFKAFCTNSTNAKIKGDTNPIEESHAQDNQVNHTNHSLLEAILLHVSSLLNDGNISDHFISAREYDQQTARVVKASAEAAILENGNNSLQARFAALSRRQARARIKKAELEMRDSGKHLKANLEAAERREKEKELEIQKLRAQLSALPVLPSNARQRPQAGPSTRRYICPSRLPGLFPDLPMDDVKDPQSDFDYQFALQSDIMDNALHRIAYGSSDPLDFDHGNRPITHIFWANIYNESVEKRWTREYSTRIISECDTDYRKEHASQTQLYSETKNFALPKRVIPTTT